MSGMEGPTAPAAPEGREGRWVKLGTIGVDSAALAITDPAFARDDRRAMHEAPKGSRSAPFGSGVQFWCGFGDGHYDVWGWVVDYGPEGQSDERIAQVVVTMIDADDLADWPVVS